MSKRALKKYLGTLEKEQLEDQVLDLYQRFKEVRTFYNFVFNPKEEQLIDEAKFKIGKEYFPPPNRKAKLRRSVAQKYIRHFLQLGVSPALLADLMLYNIEVAQTFAAEKPPKAFAFYKSILQSFEQALQYIYEQAMVADFNHRLDRIMQEVAQQEWPNEEGFERIYDQFLEK